MLIDDVHQEKFLVLTYFLMNLKLSSKREPSLETPYFIQPCVSQSDIENQYDLSLNDKLGSLLGRLHSDYVNLSLQLLYRTNT
jgi:hypothetical protein